MAAARLWELLVFWASEPPGTALLVALSAVIGAEIARRSSPSRCRPDPSPEFVTQVTPWWFEKSLFPQNAIQFWPKRSDPQSQSRPAASSAATKIHP